MVCITRICSRVYIQVRIYPKECRYLITPGLKVLDFSKDFFFEPFLLQDEYFCIYNVT